ncbi:MAG: hypothetical protein ACRD8U_09165, partial [Pyrinomonadaceae bacterium]
MDVRVLEPFPKARPLKTSGFPGEYDWPGVRRCARANSNEHHIIAILKAVEGTNRGTVKLYELA